MKTMLQIEGGVAKRSLFNIARVNWIVFMHGLRHFLFFPLSLMWKMFGRHESDDMVHGDCYGFMWLYHAPCCMTWTFCKDFYCYIKKQPKHRPMKKLFILAIAAMMLTACTKENPVVGTWEAYQYQNGSDVTVPYFNLIFTETDCTLQSTFDAQSATGSYTISDGILSVYWIDKPSVFNIEISGDVMTLTSEHETIKLTRL